MQVIIDTLFIFICSFLYIQNNNINDKTVFILLIILILYLIPALHKTDRPSIILSKYILEILYLAFFISSVYYPYLLIFTPILTGKIIQEKMTFSFFTSIILFGYALFKNPVSVLFFALLLSILAYFVYQLLYKMEYLQNQRVLDRDFQKEQELFLEKQNEALIESQDSKLHSATLEERNRIAREIHDNVGHLLTRSILQIGAIKTLNKDSSLNEPLDSLKDTLDNAMNNIRASVHDLHDESIDFESSVKEILSSATNFETNIEIQSTTLPKTLKYSFIAIIKEAVNNSIKYSNGNKIDIILNEHPAFYQLFIFDNGQNASINYNSGIGLSSIEQRIRQLNGNLKINTNDGFKLYISVMK